eukprot:7276484-Prymnesium_polylepis.1
MESTGESEIVQCISARSGRRIWYGWRLWLLSIAWCPAMPPGATADGRARGMAGKGSHGTDRTPRAQDTSSRNQGSHTNTPTNPHRTIQRRVRVRRRA